MFSPSARRSLWIAASVAVGLGVLLWFVCGPLRDGERARQVIGFDTTPPRAEMLTTDAYHARVRTILAENGLLDVEKNPQAEVRFMQTTAARSALLALVIPVLERDAHLTLLLALGQIAAGAQQEDTALLAKGTAALELFLETYLWARVEAPI